MFVTLAISVKRGCYRNVIRLQAHTHTYTQLHSPYISSQNCLTHVSYFVCLGSKLFKCEIQSLASMQTQLYACVFIQNAQYQLYFWLNWIVRALHTYCLTEIYIYNNSICDRRAQILALSISIEQSLGGTFAGWIVLLCAQLTSCKW